MNTYGAVGLPEHLKKRFIIAAPLSTHWRPVTCEQAQCPKWVNGFDIRVDLEDGTPMGVARLQYLRSGGVGRRFVEWREPAPSTMAVFRFAAGTPVPGHERAHKERIDRPEYFAVKDPQSGLYVHRGPENGAVEWAEQFAGHQAALAARQQEG